MLSEVASITLLRLQYTCASVAQSAPSYNTMATGCGVPVNCVSEIVCEVAVAVNWYQISPVTVAVQEFASGDTVAPTNVASEVTVQLLPEFIVRGVALPQLSFTGAAKTVEIPKIKYASSRILFIVRVYDAKIMLKT